MSDHHDCEGLAECLDHRRWHVYRYPGRLVWVAHPPHVGGGAKDFPTWAEAINHAQKQARKEQP